MFREPMAVERPLDMKRFDPRAGYGFLIPLRGSFDSERRNQIFQNLLDHVDTESRGDYAGLMASCSRKRQSYANPFSTSKLLGEAPQSYSQLERHYRNLIESNAYLIHREVDKLIVGDDALFIDGVIHQLYPGKMLASGGMPVDPRRIYQLSARVAVAFVFDEDGLGAGEHGYSGPIGPEHFTPVEPALLPAVFWNNPLTGRFAL